MVAVVVEDGTGKANADSYISEADAVTYLGLRGDTVFAALSAVNQAVMLRKATDYMVQVFRLRWKGSRVSINQALDWPRNFVFLDDYGNTEGQYGYGAAGLVVLNNVVPTEITHACALLALRANSGDLAPDVSRVVKRRKIDTIETEYEAGSVPWKSYRAVVNLLTPYISSMSVGPAVPLVRC
jgi:hypothetical protein